MGDRLHALPDGKSLVGDGVLGLTWGTVVHVCERTSGAGEGAGQSTALKCLHLKSECPPLLQVMRFQFVTKLKAEWEGRKLDNSMLSESLSTLASLKQTQVDAVLDSLMEKKRSRMLGEWAVIICMVTGMDHARGAARASCSNRPSSVCTCAHTHMHTHSYTHAHAHANAVELTVDLMRDLLRVRGGEGGDFSK